MAQFFTFSLFSNGKEKKRIRKRTRRHKRKRARRHRRRHRKTRRKQKGGAMTCAAAAKIVAGLQGPIPRRNIVVHTHGGSPIIGGPSVEKGEGFRQSDNFVSNGLIEKLGQYSHRDTEIRDFFTNVPDNLLVFMFTPPNCLAIYRPAGWWERQLTFLANPNWILANNAEYTDVAKLYMPGDTIYNLMIGYSQEDIGRRGLGYYGQRPEGFIRNVLLGALLSPSAPGSSFPIRTLAFVLGKISDIYAASEAQLGRDSKDRPLAIYLPICSPMCCFPNLPITPVLRQVEKKRKDTAAAAGRRFKNFKNVVEQCNILYMPPFQHPGFGAAPNSWVAVNRLWEVVPGGRSNPISGFRLRAEDKAPRAQQLSQFLIPPKESLLDCHKFKSLRSCENIPWRDGAVPDRTAGDNECAWLPKWINEYYPTIPLSQCREIGKGKVFEKDYETAVIKQRARAWAQDYIHRQAGRGVVRKVALRGLRDRMDVKQMFKEQEIGEEELE